MTKDDVRKLEHVFKLIMNDPWLGADHYDVKIVCEEDDAKAYKAEYDPESGLVVDREYDLIQKTYVITCRYLAPSPAWTDIQAHAPETKWLTAMRTWATGMLSMRRPLSLDFDVKPRR